MNHTPHTPGPWHWEKVQQEGCVDESTLVGPDVLCRYWYDKPPTADASLIATAPDLLEVCKLLIRYCSQRDGTLWGYEDIMQTFIEDRSTIMGVVERAQAAITKASGVSK